MDRIINHVKSKIAEIETAEIKECLYCAQSRLFVIMDHHELTFSEEKVAIVNEEVHILHSDISSIKLPLKSTYLLT